MMRVDLDGLAVLDAIDREGSFAAAASVLHRTQSSVSYAVRRLEEALGVPLFDRSGHRAVLTPEGRAVLDEGRVLLSRARRLETLAERFAGGWEPRLRVVVDGVLPIAPVVLALKQLGDEGVPTHVRVAMEFLRGVQRRFERDDADLMIVKDFEDGPGLEPIALPAHELVLVASAEHPAAAPGPPRDRTALQDHLELSVHDSSDETLGVDTHDVGGARVFYLSDFHAKRRALLLGLGFGWVPLGLVADDLASGALVEVPYAPGSRRRYTPHVVRRSDRPLGPCGQRLLELVISGWDPMS